MTDQTKSGPVADPTKATEVGTNPLGDVEAANAADIEAKSDAAKSPKATKATKAADDEDDDKSDTADEDKGGDQGIVAYRNLNTDEIHLTCGADPDLEARPNMERTGLDKVPPSVLDAAKRAATERSSTGQAARDRVSGGLTALEEEGPLVSTGAHYNPGGTHPAEGILSRPGMRDIQIGPADHAHPRGREALLAHEAEDRANPDRAGVIARGEKTTTEKSKRLPKP
jgi:hypothetical protein